MSARRIVPFKISSMDALGQGVSKESDKITFIPKTAPGDEGEAEISAEKKGVAFAQVKKFTRRSDQRITPDCPHFEDCPSCHYQHLPYEQELLFKKQTLERLLRKLPLPEVEVLPAIRRLGYRNRVQLHYDVKRRELGMLDAKKGLIVPIPDCRIGLPEIQEEIRRLYENSRWLQEVPGNSPKGHVEIYLKDHKLQVNWNRPYAEGGFTQVFEEMNTKLKAKLHQWLSGKNLSDVLDLFGGNGNLSLGLNYSNRLCVDQYAAAEGDFFSQDLYSAQALERVKAELNRRQMSPNLVLVDPPRAGLKGLGRWLEELKPEIFAYVSCDPHTLARDVSDLKEYRITKAGLVDFFPSTFHFESMLLFERK